MSDDETVISDGFHTMAELYSHRHALFAVIVRSYPGIGWRTLHHHPGADVAMYPGHFLAGVNPPFVGEIAYHVPLRYWRLFDGVRVIAHADPWDGYTAIDVEQRLLQWAESLVKL